MRARLIGPVSSLCAALGCIACSPELESGGGPSASLTDEAPEPSGGDPSPDDSPLSPTPADPREQTPTPSGIAGADARGPGSGDGPDDPAPNGKAPADPVPALEAPSGGCSDGTLQAGDFDLALEHDGETREFLVHIPDGYDGSAAVPLVLDLHGLTSSARQQAALSGWREKSDEEGFIVVHPQGLNASWNAGELCCGSSQSAGVDDEGFMRAIVSRLESEACIDVRRVYATGLSNGGGMAHLLACNAADVFAATAPVSMGNGTLPCQPARPVSVIMTRGTEDFLVAYDGGLFPSAAEDFTSWSELNGCSSPPTPSADGLCETRSNCAGGVEVTLCTLDAGHVLYQNSDDFSVPDAAWAVFERQALP